VLTSHGTSAGAVGSARLWLVARCSPALAWFVYHSCPPRARPNKHRRPPRDSSRPPRHQTHAAAFYTSTRSAARPATYSRRRVQTNTDVHLATRRSPHLVAKHAATYYTSTRSAARLATYSRHVAARHAPRLAENEPPSTGTSIVANPPLPRPSATSLLRSGRAARLRQGRWGGALRAIVRPLSCATLNPAAARASARRDAPHR
jgi:hypothetical protein